MSGPSTLDTFTAPGRMTSVGAHLPRVAPLPSSPGELSRVLQGLVVHEHLAGAYGRTLTDEERATVHLRPVERLLDERLRQRGNRDEWVDAGTGQIGQL